MATRRWPSSRKGQHAISTRNQGDPVNQEEIVDPLLETHEEVADRPPLPRRRRGQVGGVHGDWTGDTNTGMNVIVAGTLGIRSTNYPMGDYAPLERCIKLESTAPATRNKRGVVKVDAMFLFSVYSWEVLKTRVLATLVAVSACGGFDAVSSKVQVSVGKTYRNYHACHTKQGSTWD